MGRRLLLALFIFSLAAHLALTALAPKVKVGPLLGLALGAVAFTSLAISVAFFGGALGATLDLGTRLIWFGLGVVGCIVSAVLEWRLAADAFLIAAGTGLALIILLLFRERNILFPMALVAAVVDFWGVAAGPTALAMKSAPKMVERASVKVAALGSIEPISFVGLGDVVFVALFGGAVAAFGLRLWATLSWTMALLILAMALAILGPVPIPALPFAALALLLPNRKSFSLAREEKLAALTVTVVVASLLVVFSFFGAK